MKEYPHASINLKTGEIIFSTNKARIKRRGFFPFNPRTGDLKLKTKTERECIKHAGEENIL